MRRLIVVGLMLLVGLQFGMAQDFSAAPRHVAQISYSPDGSQLAIAAGTRRQDPQGDQNSLFLVDPQSGQLITQFKWTIGYIYGFSWSPDGQWIAYGEDGIAAVYDVGLGSKVASFEDSAGGPAPPRGRPYWCSDGLFLVEGATTYAGFKIYRASDGARVFASDDERIIGEPSLAFWNADGSQIIQMTPLMVAVWDVENLAETPRIDLIETYEIANRGGLLSPDGQILALVAADDVHFLNLDTGDLALTLIEASGPLNFGQMAWSPEGQYVAGIMKDGNIHIWSATTGEVLAQYAVEAGALAWKLDVSEIAYTAPRIARDAEVYASFIDVTCLNSDAGCNP